MNTLLPQIRGNAPADTGPAPVNSTTGDPERLMAWAGPNRMTECLPSRPADLERNSYAIYLREICRYKLLTHAEQVELGRRVRRGDAAAREQMILSNLRLVVKIAHGYENAEFPLLDLINEGNLGLITAVERFDPERGSHFSTYAAFWIRQRIRRALMNKSRTVRLPVHLFERTFRLQRVAARLHNALEREPDADELAAELGTSRREVERLQNFRLSISSLDAPLGEWNDETCANQFADERAVDPREEAARQSQLAALEAAMGSLTSREREIICQRFGLGGPEPRTLEAISSDFGLTRERIRQIQCSALRKLRRRLDTLENLAGARVLRESFKHRLFAEAA